MKHPIQPIEIDEHGTLRFKQNKIVNFLAEGRLNELSAMGFPQEDLEQLAQLIGYSLSGFGDLSYVSDETYEAAEKMRTETVSECEARNAYLRAVLEDLKQGMREPVARLFGIHPDDLGE